MGMVRRYAFAWCYLGIYIVVQIVYACLSPHRQDVLATWASTSVANLEHEPAGPLIVSVFVSGGGYLTWPVLIALALFGANRALGNTWTGLVCLAGQVIGSLVSEGIVAYRVDAGQLPVSFRHLTDVGPSYVVMSAIVISLICGSWPARLAAAFALGLMVFAGNIFGGLSSLDVAAVGHVTAAATAAVAVALLIRPRDRPRARSGT
jgi:hypothetical protein